MRARVVDSDYIPPMVDLNVQPHSGDQFKPAPQRPWTPECQLFLQEAFLVLGKARFGGAWTGKEWSVRHGAGACPHPPEEPQAGEPLKVRQPDGTTREIDRPVRWLVDGRAQTIPYEEALQRYENEKETLVRLWEARRDAHDRFQETWNELRQALFSKRVSAVVMDKNGYMTPVPKNMWSSADATNILESGEARFAAGDSYFPVTVNGRVLASEKDLEAYLNSDDQPTAESDIDTAEKAEQIEIATAANTATPAHRGGRPTKWDWEACLIEICRINHIEGLPENQMDVVRKLQDWFISQVGDAPAESEIKKRVSKVFRAIHEAGNSEDN